MSDHEQTVNSARSIVPRVRLELDKRGRRDLGAVNEPGNNSAWRDRFGDTWVRSDEAAKRRSESLGTLPEFHWWALCEGPAWDNGFYGDGIVDAARVSRIRWFR